MYIYIYIYIYICSVWGFGYHFTKYTSQGGGRRGEEVAPEDLPGAGRGQQRLPHPGRADLRLGGGAGVRGVHAGGEKGRTKETYNNNTNN